MALCYFLVRCVIQTLNLQWFRKTMLTGNSVVTVCIFDVVGAAIGLGWPHLGRHFENLYFGHLGKMTVGCITVLIHTVWPCIYKW